MAVFGQRRPRADWASHRRSRSRADGLCCRVPRASGYHLRLRLCPMAVFGRRRPRADWASHRRSRSRTGEVCWWLPYAAGSLLRLRLRLSALSPRHASSHRAVSAIGWALPGGLGGGWVFVPSPLPSSVLPLSGSGHCGGSQGFNFLGPPILSGGPVIPWKLDPPSVCLWIPIILP